MMDMKNAEIEKIMKVALLNDGDFDVPTGLAERAIRKIEKRILLKESLLELCMKGGLIMGSLLIITAILVFFNGQDVLTTIFDYLVQHWQTVTSIIIVVIFTILVDQVVIKYYLASKSTDMAENRPESFLI